MATVKGAKPLTGIKNYSPVADPAMQYPTERMGTLYFCLPQPQHDIPIIFHRMLDLHLSLQG